MFLQSISHSNPPNEKFMNILISTDRRIEQADSFLNQLEELSGSPLKTGLEEQIKDIFKKHSESLIADLLTYPQHRQNYQNIGANLSKRNLLHTFEASLSNVQKIAFFLENHDSQGLKNFCLQHDLDRFLEIPFSGLLKRFPSIKLPEDLEEIRDISHTSIRNHLIAAIIDRDKLSLKNLLLTRQELFQIGPLLTYFDCKDAFDSTWSKNQIHSLLDLLVNLKTLKINSPIITRLPTLAFCEEIDCSNCTSLHEIPDLSNCIKFDCSGCASLIELPNLPLCEKLVCICCINLNRINALPSCKFLNCMNSLNLSELSSLPLCVNLNCSYCSRLVVLPLLPDCRELNCSCCTRLERLPNMPSCRVLNHYGCSVLDSNSLPVIQRATRIQASQMIHLEDLNQDPLKILLSLENQLQQPHLAPRIQFIELDGRLSVAEDTGGVFRIFVSRLMQSLISHSNEPTGLKFIKTNSGLHMPVIDSKRDLEVQLRGFKVLGAIFKLCYERALSHQTLATGICFDRKLFDIISSLSFADLNNIDIHAKELPFETKLNLMILFSNDQLKEYLPLLRIPPHLITAVQFEQLRTIVLSNIDEEEKAPFGLHDGKLGEESKSWILAYLKKFLVDQTSEYDEWLAPVIIAKQMQQLMGTLEIWGNINFVGGEDLDIRIQGVINKDTLLSSIKWKTGNRKLDDANVSKTKEFVIKWINEASFKDLELFCNFIAGSPTLHPSKKLSFKLYDLPGENLPGSHSCHSTIDLPINYETYTIFKQKLETAILSVNSLMSSGLENI